MTIDTSRPPLTAIVTGAARGIGLATTHLFLSKGYRVAMVDRDALELKRASDGLDLVLPVECDVSQQDQVSAMLHSVMQWSGRVDALVNNAGVADFAAIQDTTFERWQTVMRTNLDGVFLCSQAVLPALRTSRGCIVNIASISGLRASTLRVAYGTSKAAVIHLTKQQAAELGEWGIRVNCVAPGSIDFPDGFWDGIHKGNKPFYDMVVSTIPFGRMGRPEEVANAVVFLSSAKASWVSGALVPVDGVQHKSNL